MKEAEDVLTELDYALARMRTEMRDVKRLGGYDRLREEVAEALLILGGDRTIELKRNHKV